MMVFAALFIVKAGLDLFIKKNTFNKVKASLVSCDLK